jgi:protein gp37
MGQESYKDGFKVTLHPHLVNVPLKWRKSRIIFVNSMSDLFHEDVPDRFIKSVFDVMAKADWHIFQVLTKRADRLSRLAPSLPWPSNVWMGVTIENNENINRLDQLKNTHAHVRFLSLEPLLGQIPKLNLSGIHWVIVGGESGPGARPIQKDWVMQVHEQCKKAKVPFFFKQWGGVRKKAAGRILDGRTWSEMPPLPKRRPPQLTNGI